MPVSVPPVAELLPAISTPSLVLFHHLGAGRPGPHTAFILLMTLPIKLLVELLSTIFACLLLLPMMVLDMLPELLGTLGSEVAPFAFCLLVDLLDM